MGSAIAASGQDVTATTQSMLQLSYSSAADLASQYPQYQEQILAAAKSSFLAGDNLAYIAGLIAVGIGIAVTFFLFPKHDAEQRLRAEFAKEDVASAPDQPSPVLTEVPAAQGA
jgi:hypothetical protein